MFVDQRFPAQVPILNPGAPSGHIDQAAYNQALRIIQARFYTRDLDYAKLTQASIGGLVGALGDPFSRYLTPGQYRQQLRSYAGQLTGIGIYVDFRGQYPVVSGVIPGAPADKAGLRQGDVIVAVGGHDTRGVQAGQVTAEIEGRAGTSVSLTIHRGAASLTVAVTRARLTVPSVTSWHFAGDILYLRVFAFQASTAREFAAQLKAGLPARGVILDLRDNPGGFIDAAQKVVSQFVASGEVFSVRDRSGNSRRTDVTGTHPATAQPLIVLVNGNTASAAEITAGALQVRRRARLVGEKTFGKGEVEEDFPLPDGGDLHLTIEHWFLPNGRSVQHNGLTPDVKVTAPAAGHAFNVVEPSLGHAGDTQLNEALKLLGGA